MRAFIRNKILGKPDLPAQSAAFRERILDAMHMYRDWARREAVVAKHGAVVADEALTELNRIDPNWWK